MAQGANFASLLADAQVASGRGSHVALRAGGREVTYAELAGTVARAGAALRARGVAAGDRVALHLPDSPGFVEAFLGAVRIGAIPVTLSTALTAEDLAYQLADCGAKLTVSPAEPLALADDACDAVDVDPAAGCFWQYSSGTTGRPKAVMHTHRGAAAPYELHGRHVAEIAADDVVHSVPKLYFSYGLNNSLTIPLRAGATVVLNDARPTPEAVFELIARHRVTLLYAVPTFYAAMLAALDRGARADLSSLRRCISAGEALPRAIFDRWRARTGLEILDGIGSTEIGYICVSNVAGRARGGTSGEVIPGYDARVVDAEGAPVADGAAGELWVRGPSTASGYWNDAPRTARTFREGGWVATGDRYTRGPDGYFTNLGRTDDMLKVGGIWVSPLEVESALLEHEAVLECAVVGRSDEHELVKPVAFVVPRDRAAAGGALAEQLQAFVKARIAPYKYPRWIEFIDELPKTATGKIQRYKLRS